MKIALLGDIHGNASALNAVLSAIKREHVNHLLITGDFVGYYYEPDVVLRYLTEWSHYAVRGNHEDMLLASHDDPVQANLYRVRYGSGVDVALASLSRKDIEDLRALPMTQEIDLNGKRLLLGHGAPWDTNCYIYQDAAEEIWHRLATYGHDYIVLGHTHHRFCKRVEKTLVINPGSVGQPRDRKPGAAWALLDTETDAVTFFNEDYDLKSLVAEACMRDPHLPYLADVLERQ
jgi:putative phosphoesterase